MSVLKQLLEELTELQELKGLMMANFDTLNAKLDEQATAINEAVNRVSEDVQALKDKIAELELDTADQSQVDQIVTRLDSGIETLKGLDPIPAVNDNGEPENQ